MRASLAERLSDAPRLSAPAQARRRLEALLAERDAAGLGALASRQSVRDLLLGLADHSPYLWRLIAEDAGRLVRLLGAPPEQSLDGAGRRARSAARRRRSRIDAGAAPRQARVGAADRARRRRRRVGSRRDDRGADALRRRRRIRGAALPAAAERARGALEPRSRMRRRSRRAPGSSCSRSASTARANSTIPATSISSCSTIPAPPRFPTASSRARCSCASPRRSTRILQERTPDGYVFRVDLRLRPDPAATPIALSIASASAYYETLGQNWERAAMIKARPAAGDLDLGRRFLADLAPFIWRKYFDYAAIADIHAMKRQIHAVRGHEQVTVPGHDVKLGPRRHSRDRILRPDAATDFRRAAPDACAARERSTCSGNCTPSIGSAPRRSTI